MTPRRLTALCCERHTLPCGMVNKTGKIISNFKCMRISHILRFDFDGMMFALLFLGNKTILAFVGTSTVFTRRILCSKINLFKNV